MTAGIDHPLGATDGHRAGEGQRAKRQFSWTHRIVAIESAPRQ